MASVIARSSRISSGRTSRVPLGIGWITPRTLGVPHAATWPAGRGPEQLPFGGVRSRLFIALIAALALPAPASAAVTDVPKVLRDQIAAAKRKTGLRVLVPSRISTPFERLYPGISINEQSYDLNLGAVKGCNEATACFVAAFLGEKTGARAIGRKRVELARGRLGRFTPTSCGASCAAPQVQWREHGTLYTVQAKIGSKDTERRRLVA